MSHTIRCFLVDWNRFTTIYARAGELGEALRGNTEIARWGSQSTLNQNWLVRAADAIRDGCPGPSAEALLELFRHLFWTYGSRAYRIVELLPEPDLDPETAWSDVTTRHFASLASRIDLNEFRVLFEASHPLRYRTYDTEFAEFEVDAKLWIEAVKQAGSEARGLVVTQYGERIQP